MIRIADYKKTLIFATVMLLLTVQKHAGFMIFLFVPFFMIYVVHSLFLMIKQPDPRQVKATPIMIWILVVLIVSSVHGYWRVESRRDANAVVSAIEAFKEKTGVYPQSLAEIGFNDDALRHDWMLGYHYENGRPFVVYADTFMVFASYSYDFEAHQWKHDGG